MWFMDNGVMELMETFIKWCRLKFKLDTSSYLPPMVHERDLWWISFGKNVGSEINGKSSLFSRPGIILKKLSRKSYLVIPTTTKPKEGSWYTGISLEGRKMYACLHQARTIDYRRLSSRMGQVDSEDFKKIKEAFWNLYK